MACPETWPRPINGSGHFRELCDVTMRHLAGLCNFGTVPKLNLAPWLNPNHSMHFHAHAGTQKSISISGVPELWPRPINGSGHFRELCDVTMCHLAGLCNFGTLCKLNLPHGSHFHAHAGTQKSISISGVSRTLAPPHKRKWTFPGAV